MKVLSEKKSICTSIKISYNKDENFREDIKQRKQEGWRIAKRPNWYDGRYDEVIKYTSNETIVTYIRYDEYNTQ